jgi:hypothetical protein
MSSVVFTFSILTYFIEFGRLGLFSKIEAKDLVSEIITVLSDVLIKLIISSE